MPPSKLVFLLVIAIALGIAGCGDEPRRPNFIVILADDQEASSFTFMPNLQELLVDQGTTFENFFLNDPICCPARSTIFLGEYRQNHLLEQHDAGCSYRFFEEGKHLRSMGKLLHDAGYRTSYIGKALNRYHMYLERAGPGDEDDHLLAGWSDYHVIVMPGYYGFQLHENGEIRTVPPGTASYQTDVLSKLGQDFLERNAGSDEPFLLFIAPDAPHEPAIPPKRHESKFKQQKAPRPPSFNEADVQGQPGLALSRPLTKDRIDEIDERYRNTLRSLLAVDEMVRDLISTLAGNDQLADTYVFYLSDNGLHFGQHRIAWGKGTPYEESVRIPLVVRGPGVEPGRVLTRLITNADLLPTLLDLAGQPTPDNIDGRSFASLLGPDAESQPWRNAIPLESRHEKRNQGVPAFGAIRTERYKWIEYEDGSRALYDLETDPHELTNIAGGGNTEIGAALSKQLEAILACKGPTCRTAEDAPVPTGPRKAK